MAEILPEKWMKGVAVTVTVLAVLTAIASSRSAFYVAQAQLLTALEGSKWSYYQAKSIKQSLAETQLNSFEVEILGITNAAQKKLMEQKMAVSSSEIKRYDQEKAEIRQGAEQVAKDNALAGRRGGQISLSVVFYQIGIMLSSVSALIKRKELWILGLVFGVVACVFLANGFLLFF
jgi:hypothetical protein